MAPLSILPGRMRLESQELVGKPHVCRYLQKHIIHYMNGLTEVTVNHITGRILVRFDERQIDRQDLTQRIRRIMHEALENVSEDGQSLAGEENAMSLTTRSALHAITDMVAHAIFPKPLNTLIPMAIKVTMGR